MGVVQHIVKKQNVVLSPRKLIHSCAEPRPEKGAGHGLLGVRPVGNPTAIGTPADRRVPSSLKRQISCGAVNPGAECGFAPEAGQTAERTHPGFLRQVGRLVLVARHAEQQEIDVGGVPVD